MTMNFLDATGLAHFWAKVKAHVLQNGIFYGTCGTGGGTVAKVATVTGVTELKTGLTVAIKFTAANTAANPTLNVNSLGAKAIKRYGTTAPSTSAASSWNANSVVTLTYDGTYWQMHDWNNTTYSSMSVAEYEAGTSTSTRVITPARLKAAILHWALPATTSIPSKVSDLTNDSGFISTETDPVFTASVAYGISSSDISNWNGKSELSISSDGDLDGATYTITDGNTTYPFPSSDRFTTANVGLLTYIQSLAVNGNLFPTTITGNMYNLVLDGDDIAYDANTSVNAKIDTIISSGGEPNAINTISVNNVNQTITNKNVNIETVIIGSTSDYTPTQVKSAIDSGKNVIITYTHSTYGNIVGYSFNYSQAYNALVSNTIAYYNNSYYLFEIVGTLTNNNWSCEVTQIAQSSDIPTVPTNISAFTNDSGFITGMTILSYGNSTWQDFIDAYNANKVVYCRASSNSNPASGSQTRLAFMAYVNNATNPTEVEFQYYRSVSSHSASQQGDQVYVYKLTSAGTWSVTVREASSKIATGTGLTSTYSNGIITLSSTVSVPTKVSDLTNDSGFLTLATLPIYNGGVS